MIFARGGEKYFLLDLSKGSKLNVHLFALVFSTVLRKI